MEIKTDRHDKDDARMDRPYSWVVCFSSFIICFVMYGCLKSSGVFFVALLETFDTSRSDAAIIYTTMFASMFGASGLLGGPSVHRFGFKATLLVGSGWAFLGIFSSYFVTEGKYLILTMGIVQGTGFGIAFLPMATVNSQYFKRHLGKASGISMTGSGLGSVVIPPLAEFLISVYGLQGSFLILSAISLHMVVASMLIRNPQTKDHSEIKKELQGIDNNAIELELVDSKKSLEDNHEFPALKMTTENYSEAEQVKEVEHLESIDKIHQKENSPECSPIPETQRISYFRRIAIVLKNKYGVGLIIFFSCINMALSGFSITIPDFSVSSGYNLRESSLLISIFSGFDIVSRLLIGFLTDLKCVNLVLSLAIGIFSQAVMFFLIGLFGNNSYLLIAILSALFGITYGGSLIHIPVIATRYVGKDNLSVMLSICAIVAVIPLFSLGPLQTYMQATFGNYIEFYYILGSIFMATSMYWFFVSFTDILSKRNSRKDDH